MSKLKRKKKNYHHPFDETPANHPDEGNKTQNQLNVTSTPKIFERAIASAEKHGIRLKPGKKNGGYGNCSYESVIININERDCFKEKLPMSPDYYRRVWNTDMLNKLLD